MNVYATKGLGIAGLVAGAALGGLATYLFVTDRVEIAPTGLAHFTARVRFEPTFGRRLADASRFGYSGRVTRDDHEDEVAGEEIERRREIRGTMRGLSIALLPPGRADFDAVEASRRAFFVHVDRPDAYGLGDILDARIERAGHQVVARLEVIRKEIDPRTGVALRIVSVPGDGERVLREILGPLADPVAPPEP